MGREFELKYTADPETLEKLAECFPDSREIRMQTTYYDTPEHVLSSRMWTFRQRMENDESICTVKTPSDGVHARGEWEIRCTEISKAPELLAAAGAPAELPELTRNGVVPVCGARFTRRAVRIFHADSELELALDSGVLTGGAAEIPLCEVEVELKQGLEKDAQSFAEDLARRYGLKPEPKSKFARARELQC